MSDLPELAQLELLAQVDELVARLQAWVALDSNWGPARSGQALLRRVLQRAESLRIRLEAPLVVATFGGTGTGKSSLINALVGRECSQSGRQRPTTTRPILIAHPLTPLESLGLPLDEVEVQTVDAPILRDLVLLDCPDPDTNEAAAAGTNLARLRRLVPHCDVLLYTTTQQKYRSARVGEELLQAASGCRLVFVQTHADLDSDIRSDWRMQLSERYHVPDLFFVDSVRALQEQQASQRPSGDFARLLDLLFRELGSAQRTQIRRANLLDLLQAALELISKSLNDAAPALDELERLMTQQRAKLLEQMAGRLKEELLAGRQLWERRLLGAVTEHWGLSPFSAVLRIYHGFGTLLASAGLTRARSTAQLAVLGVIQTARWFQSRQSEQIAEQRLAQLDTLGLEESQLRSAQLVLQGAVLTAQIDCPAAHGMAIEALKERASGLQSDFLLDAGQQVDQVINKLAIRHARWYRRLFYEILWLAFVSYIAIRVGKNFFYDSVWLKTPILTFDFYIAAAGFLLLWSGCLLIFFLRGLRRGLGAEITNLAQNLAHGRMGGSLFPDLEQSLLQARHSRQVLLQLTQQTIQLRRDIATPSRLGGTRND